ncbi:MAG: DUF4446 family protein [Actinobacteria bacterium]|nr:DUF4446 family protein [Actinomycetota bacterium]
MDQQTLISVVTAGAAFLALLAAIVANNRLSGIRKSLLMLQGRKDGQTMLEVLANYTSRIDSFEKVLRRQNKRQEELFAMLGDSARNLGVVRYDAFDDMGGRMSFSAAFLDDHGNGLVITSINARAESRAYAKAIRGGDSDHNLSTEEQAAIADALGTQKAKR